MTLNYCSRKHYTKISKQLSQKFNFPFAPKGTGGFVKAPEGNLSDISFVNPDTLDEEDPSIKTTSKKLEK